MASSHPDRRRVRVFVVEDDALLRPEFERMIGAHPELALAGSVSTLAEARRQLASASCDIAIVDLGLPDGDGCDLIAMLRETAPDIAVLVSTVFGDEAHVVRAIEAGARGYLLKDTTLDDFARSLLAVHAGGAPLSPQIARYLLKRFAPDPGRRQAAATGGAAIGPTDPGRRAAAPAAALGAESLTPRETDILRHIALGYSTAETATRLGLSGHTVSTHIKSIYGKLMVRNRVEVVNAARRKGFIP
ncbi:DNA-binding response regulator [Bordetella sputigena]|uniref:response regulator n=1 Tax=Bordetella sputigena TaxID=1416810 RepID=UPI0039F12B77